MCNCVSYNLPEPYQMDDPVIINGISVDACIADTMRAVWNAGISTGYCCCGHGRQDPSIIIAHVGDVEYTRKVIEAVDNRRWQILCNVTAVVGAANADGIRAITTNMNNHED